MGHIAPNRIWHRLRDTARKVTLVLFRKTQPYKLNYVSIRISASLEHKVTLRLHVSLVTIALPAHIDRQLARSELTILTPVQLIKMHAKIVLQVNIAMIEA